MLDRHGEDERVSRLVASRCGYVFPGVRSLGHVRFQLVPRRGVRLGAFSHFPTPSFSPRPPYILS